MMDAARTRSKVKGFPSGTCEAKYAMADGYVGGFPLLRTRLRDAQVLVVEVYRDGLLRRVGEEREHPAMRLRELDEDRPPVVVILHVRPADVALELIAFGGQLEAWRGLVGHERSQRTCATRGEGNRRDRKRCASRAAWDAPATAISLQSATSAPPFRSTSVRKHVARPSFTGGGSTSPDSATPGVAGVAGADKVVPSAPLILDTTAGLGARHFVIAFSSPLSGVSGIEEGRPS